MISAGIHMSEIPAFSYDLLWEERTLGSVANLTRADGEDLLRIAPEVPVRAAVTTYPLEDAQRALEDARAGQDRGLRRPRRRRVADAARFGYRMVVERETKERDHMADTPSNTDEAKGRVKEAAGNLTGDKDLKNEGKADKASGKLKEGIDKVRDALHKD